MLVYNRRVHMPNREFSGVELLITLHLPSRFLRQRPRLRRPLGAACGILTLCLLACSRGQPEIIVITATAPGIAANSAPTATPLGIATPIPGAIVQTDDTVPVQNGAVPEIYSVQPGDTLSTVAVRYGTTTDVLMQINRLANPDQLEVGQVLLLPSQTLLSGSDLPLLSDGRLVRGPGSAAFDVAAFIQSQPGYLRTASDLVEGALLTGAQVVERVALEYSVDARVLLTLIEMRTRLLSNPTPSDEERTYALRAPASRFGFDRNGLYRQLAWAADQLNSGYYGWKYRGLSVLTFEDGRRAQLATSLNAGSAAVQVLFSQYSTPERWRTDVSGDGFPRAYRALFGDPLAGGAAFDPAQLRQPEFSLPFVSETWYFTGGPHGGWGAGSAWAAVDFAPPDDPSAQTSACYISEHAARAAAPGVIARSNGGSVLLDLDGDGDEATGWTLLYLHMSSRARIPVGARVAVGDRIGYPSCEGGVSNGTHLHLARRYNGEWLPADCSECAPALAVPSFTLGGWTAVGLRGQEYQGYLVRGGEQKVAEAMRGVADNLIPG